MNRTALLHCFINSPYLAVAASVAKRLSLLREFAIDEKQLAQLTRPVLLIASRDDQLLPSVSEAQHLAKIFPHAQVVTLPHSGHACLAEIDVNLLKIMQSKNF